MKIELSIYVEGSDKPLKLTFEGEYCQIAKIVKFLDDKVGVGNIR